MMLSHRIELDPTNAQATHLAQAAGVARFAYNWALGLWHDIYQLHKLDPDVAPTSEAELRKALNSEEIIAVWRGIGSITPDLYGDAYGRFVSSEVKRWADVVKSSGAKLE